MRIRCVLAWIALILLCASVLGQEQTEDVDSLIKDLKDENSTVRFEAVAALEAAWAYGWLNNTRSVEPLIQALNDTDWRVRAATAAVLGETYDTRVVEPLIQALKGDSNSTVREEAAASLGELKDPRGVAPLIYALRDNNNDVRSEAAWALGMIGDTKAIDPLILALKDNYSLVRRNAAQSLGWINDTRAVDPLIQLLNEEKFVQDAATEALKKLGVNPQLR